MFMKMKLKIQNFGRFLSNMIMPNISIFIAYGIMTSLFISSGWIPNQRLETLISPMVMYVLPILIGYQGGFLISNTRGGLSGVIATLGVISSSDIPMLLGAMISGPLGGWTIKYFDMKIKNKVANGFEMLVNNFSIAIIGTILAIISFLAIGPFIKFFLHFLKILIQLMIDYSLLPLISFIIEPAKIFFLNNVINHGIFSPLGIQEISENHNSIFFLMESNPGPGLGVLIAWFFFGKGPLQKSSGSASIIEFFGGVHEVYFPYILIKPQLIISLILGSIVNVLMLILFHGGLIAVASPGSILSILAMTPKGYYLINMFSIMFSFLVSFISSCFLLKFSLIKKIKNIFLKDSYNVNILLKNTNNILKDINVKKIHNIVFACDAGMGSSALGASMLRKKIKDSNLKTIHVTNTAIDFLPESADLIITHQSLTYRAKMYAPYAQHLSLKNFLNYAFYDNLVNELTKNKVDSTYDLTENNTNQNSTISNLFQLTKKNIILNQKARNKKEAIKIVGKHLVKQGYVNLSYIDSMLEREKQASTWLGESIALPHGTIASKESILQTGIIFCQFPQGVHFGDETDDIAYLVIGVAAKNDEHITVVRDITNALDNTNTIKILSKTNSEDEVLQYLTNQKK